MAVGMALGACDRDGEAVPAFVRMAKGIRTLDLCAHCYIVHAAALMADGWDVAFDKRADLSPA